MRKLFIQFYGLQINIDWTVSSGEYFRNPAYIALLAITNSSCTEERNMQCFMKRCYANFFTGIMQDNSDVCRINHDACGQFEDYQTAEENQFKTALFNYIDSTIGSDNIPTFNGDQSSSLGQYFGNENVSESLQRGITACTATVLEIWLDFDLNNSVIDETQNCETNFQENTQGEESIWIKRSEILSLPPENNDPRQVNNQINDHYLSIDYVGENYISTFATQGPQSEWIRRAEVMSLPSVDQDPRGVNNLIDQRYIRRTSTEGPDRTWMSTNFVEENYIPIALTEGPDRTWMNTNFVEENYIPIALTEGPDRVWMSTNFVEENYIPISLTQGPQSEWLSRSDHNMSLGACITEKQNAIDNKNALENRVEDLQTTRSFYENLSQKYRGKFHGCLTDSDKCQHSLEDCQRNLELVR